MIEEDDEEEEEDYRTFVGGYVSYALNDNLPEIISETPYFKPNISDVHLSQDQVKELEEFEGLESVRYLFEKDLQENKENTLNADDIFADEEQIFDENELIIKTETDFLSKNSFDSDNENKENSKRDTKILSPSKEEKPREESNRERKRSFNEEQEKETTKNTENTNEETKSDDETMRIDGKENDKISKQIKDTKKSSEENVMRIIEKCQSDDAFILDLSKRDLLEVPSAVLNLKDIKYLYLEGNGLPNLPECFFYELPAVQWLDLRNNRLSNLPSSIGSHVNLVHLLIEGNRFYRLTPEIGLLTTLRGLNFRNNPLQDPPPEILALGLRETLYYLRQKLPIYNEGAPTRTSRSVLGTIKKRSGPFDPTRHCSLPSCRNKNYNPGKSYDGPSLESIDTKAKAEKEREIQKLRKEHVDAIIQHIKNDLALKTWRDRARHQQLKYMSMFDERDFISPALQAPFDIDEEYLSLPSRKQIQQKDNLKKQRYEISPGYMDAARLSKEKELEKKIRTHLEKLQISSSDGNMDLDKAAQELRKVEQLQRELAQLFRPMM